MEEKKPSYMIKEEDESVFMNDKTINKVNIHR